MTILSIIAYMQCVETVEQFREAIRSVIGDRSLSGTAVGAGLPRDAIRNILVGHDPKLSRAIEVANALGLDLQLNPSRSPDRDTASANDMDVSEERHGDVTGLARVIRDAVDEGLGGIRRDLNRALTERLTAELLAGELSPEALLQLPDPRGLIADAIRSAVVRIIGAWADASRQEESDSAGHLTEDANNTTD